jgi:hypothetical protein
MLYFWGVVAMWASERNMARMEDIMKQAWVDLEQSVVNILSQL